MIVQVSGQNRGTLSKIDWKNRCSIAEQYCIQATLFLPLRDGRTIHQYQGAGEYFHESHCTSELQQIFPQSDVQERR